jgi:hypothetical protein
MALFRQRAGLERRQEVDGLLGSAAFNLVVLSRWQEA